MKYRVKIYNGNGCLVKTIKCFDWFEKLTEVDYDSFNELVVKYNDNDTWHHIMWCCGMWDYEVDYV